MPLTYQGQAPYAPASAVTTVIDKHRSNGLSVPVDITRLIQIGVSEALVQRTLKALRLLDLLNDDGTLTEQMDLLGKAQPVEYQERVGEWVRSVYAPIFQAVGDPAAAAPKDLENAFFGYEPKGQLNRMVTLFTGLCAYAGIIDKPTAKKPGPSAGKMAAGKPTAKKAAASHAGRVGPRSGKPPASIPSGGLDGAKARYVDVLLSKIETQDSPDADLFDRIERVLGVAPGKEPEP